MLSKNLYFIHNFDAKMHYSLYYSLLKIKDSDGIDINDSVQSKKCNLGLGRWNFIVAGQDFSCGIYHALEKIRQSVFLAMKNNKNSVDITLLSAKKNSDVCYIFNHEKEFESSIEQLKAPAQYHYKNKEGCECDKKISKKVLVKVIKPVLENMFEKINFQIKPKFNDKIINNQPSEILFKPNSNIFRIEWYIDKSSNDLLMKQNITENELQLTS